MAVFSNVNLEGQGESAQNRIVDGCANALFLDSVPERAKVKRANHLALVADTTSESKTCKSTDSGKTDLKRMDIAEDYKHASAFEKQSREIVAGLSQITALTKASLVPTVHHRYIDTEEGKKDFKCQLDKQIKQLSTGIQQLAPELDYCPQAKDAGVESERIWTESQKACKDSVLPRLNKLIQECAENDPRKYDRDKREAILACLTDGVREQSFYMLSSPETIVRGVARRLGDVSRNLIDLREEAFEKLTGRTDCVEYVPLDSALRSYNRSAKSAGQFSRGIEEMIPETNCSQARWKENKKDVDQYFTHLEKTVQRVNKTASAPVGETFPDGMPTDSKFGYEQRKAMWSKIGDNCKQLPKAMNELKELLATEDGSKIDSQFKQQVAEKCKAIRTLLKPVDISDHYSSYFWHQEDRVNEPEQIRDLAQALTSLKKSVSDVDSAIWKSSDNNGHAYKWSRAREHILPAVKELDRAIDGVHNITTSAVLDDTNDDSIFRYTCLINAEQSMREIDKSKDKIDAICAELESKGNSMNRNQREEKFDELRGFVGGIGNSELYNLYQLLNREIRKLDSVQEDE